MRNSLIAVMAMLLLVACQPQRYTEQSPEIDTAKLLINGYVEGDYSAHAETYSDTAKIYYNSEVSVTLDEAIKAFKGQLELFSDIRFDDDISFEFVTTDDGEQWVGWWSVWHAKFKATGQEFSIPIHVSAQFVDGKVVEEWGYWDNQPIAEAVAKYAASQAETEVEE